MSKGVDQAEKCGRCRRLKIKDSTVAWDIRDRK